MKGHERVLELLNEVLADELTAISQYMVHSEMCGGWGFHKLHELIEKRAMKEMEHAEELIERILFLEGDPVVSKLNKIHIGADVEKMFQNDLAAEYGAIKAYNAAIKEIAQLGDYGTRQFLGRILQDEEDHAGEIEEQRDLIAQIGLQNYLAQQIG